MPNTNSAAKRLRQSRKRYLSNRSVRSHISSLRREMMKALDQQDSEAGQQVYRQYCSTLDKAAKKGVIRKNTAQRRKARAANRLRAFPAA